MVRKIAGSLIVLMSLSAAGFAAEDPTPLVPSASTPKSGRGSKLHLGLGGLRDYALTARTMRSQGLAAPELAANPALRVVNDMVVVDAVASGDANALGASLQALGMQNVQVNGRVVSGLMPFAAMDAAENLTSMKFMRPALVGKNVGLVTSQGDLAMHANTARGTFSVNGTGVKVGVMSDSYNCLGGAATGVSTLDLPSGVTVLKDISPCTGTTDEGRAMMEIVHDVAPGSPLSFYTAYGGQADFANGIKALASDGAKVIVDDVFYYAEPYFQDGIIAQAVDYVKGNGVAYFSSAGNQADHSYEAAFLSGGASPFVQAPGTAHNFNHTPGPADIYQRFTMPSNSSVAIVLQWDSPFGSVGGTGSPNDVDISLLNDPPTTWIGGSTSNNIGGDPVEVLQINCGAGGGCAANLMITLYNGPAPGKLKYIYYGRFTPEH